MSTYAPEPYFALPGAPYPTCAVEDCNDDGTQIALIHGEPVRICADHRRTAENRCEVA